MQHLWCTMTMAYKPSLSNTYRRSVVHSSSQLSAKQYTLWRYHFGESCSWIRQLRPGMLSIDVLLQSEHEKYVCHAFKNFCWNIFTKVKTRENLVLYGSLLSWNDLSHSPEVGMSLECGKYVRLGRLADWLRYFLWNTSTLLNYITKATEWISADWIIVFRATTISLDCQLLEMLHPQLLVSWLTSLNQLHSNETFTYKKSLTEGK